MSNSPVDRSRRGFFTGSFFTREGREQVKKQLTRNGPVPPGLARSISADNCLNCEGNCAKICPQEIISLHAENHDLKNQPFLNFKFNNCTFCYDCNRACPVFTVDKEHTKGELGKAELNTQSCYAWLDIICMSCMNVCPDKLIKFSKKRKPSIQLDSCTGCGACIRICPATAIRIVS